ncbi:protein HIRA isoform X2 [Bemisia tabaci]|uniref:protein HIRA isoform X2 n=1 Tax=Bemisia tabaci TaxID=7038 RepID=UPI003B27BD07
MKIFKPAWVNHGNEGMGIFSIDIHPDGSRFATGGQGEDSGRVTIWNMAPITAEKVEKDEKVPKMLCQLDNHLACVNSVRWSFSGRYLASGGDDKLVMVWSFSKYAGGSNPAFGSGGKMNAESWRCISTLRGHNGDVLDLAWSPHDVWLATCSVDNTIIIWDADKLPQMVTILKGHTGLVKGVTWDPVGKYLSSQSDDKSLRIWRTIDWQQEAVIEEPFKECSGTTLCLRPSWSPDGQYLVSAHAMNNGGPTAQIIERDGWKSDMDYVGHRKAVTCVNAAFEKIYGTSLLNKQRNSSLIIENPEILAAIENRTSKKGDTAQVNNSASEHTSEKPQVSISNCNASASVKLIPTNKQIETRTSDGRRRITPIFIPAAPDTGEAPAPFCSDNVQFSSSSEAKSKIIVEKREDIVVKPNVTPSNSNSEPLVENTNVPPNKLTTYSSIGVTLSVNVGKQASKRPAEKIVRGSLTNILTPMKKPKFMHGKTTMPDSLTATVPHQQSSKFSSAISENSKSLNLPSLELQPFERIEISNGQELRIKNDFSPSLYGAITVVQMQKDNDNVIWEQAFGSPVCGCVINSKYVALAFSDTLHLLSIKTGMHIISPIVLKALPSYIHLNSKSFLLYLVSTGHLSVICVDTLKTTLSDISIFHLFHQQNGGEVSLRNCTVSEKGVPMIVLSTLQSYVYSSDFHSWLLVSNNRDAMVRNSIHQTRNDPSAVLKATGERNLPLHALQHHNFSSGSMLVRSSELTPMCTFAFLERQLIACKTLESSIEYKFWLLATVRYLLQQGDERKLRIIFEDLLGPTHSGVKVKSSWEPTVLGLSKHELLRSALNEAASSLQVQRLYTEFSDQLNSATMDL